MAIIRAPKRDDSLARRLRHQVKIQRVAQTASGPDIDNTWTTLRTVWAEVAPLKGREFWERNQVHADVTHTVTCRWEDLDSLSVTPKDRVVHDSRTFEVESVRNIDERDRLAVMMTKEAI